MRPDRRGVFRDRLSCWPLALILVVGCSHAMSVDGVRHFVRDTRPLPGPRICPAARIVAHHLENVHGRDYFVVNACGTALYVECLHEVPPYLNSSTNARCIIHQERVRHEHCREVGSPRHGCIEE